MKLITGYKLGRAIEFLCSKPGFHRLSVLKQKSLKMFSSWRRNVCDRIGDKDGWELILKGLAGGIALWSVLQGMRLYYEGHLSKARDQAEHDYQELINKLGNTSSVVRAGGILSVPELMRRRVPVKEQIGNFWTLARGLGFTFPEEQLYQNPLRMLVGSVLKFRRSEINPLETKALLSILSDLGEEGWYHGEVRKSIEHGYELAWIWQSDRSGAVCRAGGRQEGSELLKGSCANELLIEAQLPGVDLSGMHLEEADLSKANLNRANLRGIYLTGARLEDASLQDSILIEAKVARAIMSGVILVGVKASLADFSGTDLRHAQLDGADLRGAKFIGANLLGASLRGAKLGEANFQNAELGDAALDGAGGSGIDLTGANLRHATLEKTDLSVAQAQGVLGWLKIKTLTHSKMRGIKGLTQEEIRFAKANRAEGLD